MPRGETVKVEDSFKVEVDSAGDGIMPPLPTVAAKRRQAPSRATSRTGRPTTAIGGKKAVLHVVKPRRAIGGNKVKRVTKDQVAFQRKYRRRGWAKTLVWRGTKVRTSGGLQRKDLMCNKNGRVVSKRQSQIGKRSYRDNHLDLWQISLMQQRVEKACKGFVKIKKAGTRLERALWEDTCKNWMDMVAVRVVKMLQTQPQLMGKVNQRLNSREPCLVPANLVSGAAGTAKMS